MPDPTSYLSPIPRRTGSISFLDRPDFFSSPRLSTREDKEYYHCHPRLDHDHSPLLPGGVGRRGGGRRRSNFMEMRTRTQRHLILFAALLGTVLLIGISKGEERVSGALRSVGEGVSWGYKAWSLGRTMEELPTRGGDGSIVTMEGGETFVYSNAL
jgi:hypothetical protein